MLVRMAATSYVGDQRFWRMSRQSSPLAYTLGWNILETNRTATESKFDNGHKGLREKKAAEADMHLEEVCLGTR